MRQQGNHTVSFPPMARWILLMVLLLFPIGVLAQTNTGTVPPDIKVQGRQLETAFYNHDLDAIKQILDAGYPINRPLSDSFSLTPLNDACLCDCPVAILRLLVARGANVNESLSEGITLLMVAAQHTHIVAFRYLISVGADVKAVDKQHKTLLHYAAMPEFNTPDASSDADADAKMALLLHLGVPVDARDDDGDTALIIAAGSSSVKSLLHAGANARARNHVGTTALMAAASNGHCEAARQLIACGADVNAWDDQGWTALVYVVDSARGENEDWTAGMKCIVKLLFRHHAKFAGFALEMAMLHSEVPDGVQGSPTSPWVVPLLRKYGAR